MEGMDWVHLAQDRDKWQAVVNTVMNLWIHKMWGISWLAWELIASEEGPSSVELILCTG
jgi:hypothetical protein